MRRFSSRIAAASFLVVGGLISALLLGLRVAREKTGSEHESGVSAVRLVPGPVVSYRAGAPSSSGRAVGGQAGNGSHRAAVG